MKKLYFVLLLCLSSVSWSQPVANVGATTTYQYIWNTLNGIPTATVQPVNLGPQSYNLHNYGVNADGSIGVTGHSGFRPSQGGGIVVDVASTVSKPTVVGAVSRFLGKVAYPLTVGIAAYDFAKEMGYLLDNSSGQLVVKKNDPSVCSVAPCYEYVTTYGPGFHSSSADASCRAAAAYYASLFPQFNPVYAGSSETICNVNRSQYGPIQLSITHPSIAPVSAVLLASTLQELADAIAAKSGWPTSSALARTFNDALKSGETAQTENPVVSGPASSPGAPTAKSVNTTNNTTSTTTNTNNYNYAGPSVKVTNVTNTVVINNTTGSTVSDTTDTKDEPPKDSATDTDLPAQVELYKRKYPDGLTGVWNTKKAELLQTPLLQLTGNMMPTIGTSAGYPSWPIPIVVGRWNFGIYDVSPASYVWDFLKVCVILGSLFLARALIFGG